MAGEAAVGIMKASQVNAGCDNENGNQIHIV